MNAEVVITIIFVLLTAVVFAWGLYQKVKGNAAAAASEFIAMAQKNRAARPRKNGAGCQLAL